MIGPLDRNELVPRDIHPMHRKRLDIKNLLRTRSHDDIDTVDDEATHRAQVEANPFKHRTRAIYEPTIRNAFHIGIGLDRRALEAA